MCIHGAKNGLSYTLPFPSVITWKFHWEYSLSGLAEFLDWSILRGACGIEM